MLWHAQLTTTDRTPASFASVLAFTETVFGLPPITTTTWDANAYNYIQSFNFNQKPLPPAKMATTVITPQMLRDVQTDPPDPDDPT